MCIRAETTLSLLTLKPGLLMAAGRDVCGNLWLHRLGLDEICEPRTLLNAPSSLSPHTKGALVMWALWVGHKA
jgi:hypothetical protein